MAERKLPRYIIPPTGGIMYVSYVILRQGKCVFSSTYLYQRELKRKLWNRGMADKIIGV
jgi:hypothetical protein